MGAWPKHPAIYEINTWVWLEEMSRRLGREIRLDNVPEAEWARIAYSGLDGVWLMGVWERSPAGIAIASRNHGLLEDFRRALPDFRPEDNVGSPYCIRRYEVDPRLGGRKGLAAARKELARRGLKLLVDFVPNHVAPDHPWVREHPDYFVHGSVEEAGRDPAAFVASGGRIFACGRDPYFPAWPDVLQLNAFHNGLRDAVIRTLDDIAGQADGVRCDMAMLVLNSIFERTWGTRVGRPPASEYWGDILPAVRRKHPDFLFIAEAYWDTEWELQHQGFDYCYDKRLYDRLVHGVAPDIRAHLLADVAFQSGLVRFIENHDEPRAHATFDTRKERAAAVTVATIPGATLYHEGQLEGRRVRVPVFLRRRPEEPLDTDLQGFYRRLLVAGSIEGMREGDWQLCECTGWPDNTTCRNILAWCWHGTVKRRLVVVNLSPADAQAHVRLPWHDLGGRNWLVTDSFTRQPYDRRGDELAAQGLYVDLPPWGFHVLAHWIPK